MIKRPLLTTFANENTYEPKMVLCNKNDRKYFQIFRLQNTLINKMDASMETSSMAKISVYVHPLVLARLD